jgi:Ca2+-binding EF-hand superfamily protein
MNDDLKNNTTKSETQKENWLTKEQIDEVSDGLANDVKKLKVGNVSKKEFNTILTHMVMSLFTKIPPRRNIDYTLMKVSSDMTDMKFNYLDAANKKMVFNNYKTQKKYSQVIVDIPDDLWSVIKEYIRYHPFKKQMKNKKHDVFFLVDYNNKNLSNSNDITKILNGAFGSKVGSSLLRNMYLSNKYSDVIEDLQDDAAAMSTSVGTAMTNYIKKD